MRSLPEQIAANKRLSLIYAFGLVLVLAGLGTAIVGTYAPREWYFGTIGATLVGGIYAWLAVRSGSSIVLQIARARDATPEEDRVLRNVVEEMALAAGLPVPRVVVIDDDSPNAFATGNDPAHATIAVTRGILRVLDRDELQGVVAHEMGHIRNYDIQFMTAIALIAGLIPMLSDLFIQAQWFTGFGRGRDSNDRDGGDASGIFQIVGIVLAILGPTFALLLQAAVSRQREFLADATAAELTRYPEGLANALRKIALDPIPLGVTNRAIQHLYIVSPQERVSAPMRFGSRSALSGPAFSGPAFSGPAFSGRRMVDPSASPPVQVDPLSTHPSIEARVRALMGLMGSTH